MASVQAVSWLEIACTNKRTKHHTCILDDHAQISCRFSIDFGNIIIWKEIGAIIAMDERHTGGDSHEVRR
jgi:hypothetical protein